MTCETSRCRFALLKLVRAIVPIINNRITLVTLMIFEENFVYMFQHNQHRLLIHGDGDTCESQQECTRTPLLVKVSLLKPWGRLFPSWSIRRSLNPWCLLEELLLECSRMSKSIITLKWFTLSETIKNSRISLRKPPHKDFTRNWRSLEKGKLESSNEQDSPTSRRCEKEAGQDRIL